MKSAGFLEEASPELGSRAIFRAFEQSGRVTGIAGYRHVYLEGMEEASIFVHVAVSDISGKVRAACRTPVPPQPRCQVCRVSWVPCWACFSTGQVGGGGTAAQPPLPISLEPPQSFCVSGSLVLRPSLALLPVPRIPGWGTSPVSPFLSSGPRRGPVCGGVSGMHGGLAWSWCPLSLSCHLHGPKVLPGTVPQAARLLPAVQPPVCPASACVRGLLARLSASHSRHSVSLVLQWPPPCPKSTFRRTVLLGA